MRKFSFNENVVQKAIQEVNNINIPQNIKISKEDEHLLYFSELKKKIILFSYLYERYKVFLGLFFITLLMNISSSMLIVRNFQIWGIIINSIFAIFPLIFSFMMISFIVKMGKLIFRKEQLNFLEEFWKLFSIKNDDKFDNFDDNLKQIIAFYSSNKKLKTFWKYNWRFSFERDLNSFVKHTFLAAKIIEQAKG